MHRQFHPQIAARHHDAVGHFQNFGEGLDRRRFLDLGQDGGAAIGQKPRLMHVFGALHERQGQPIDAKLADKLQIAAVLVRQRRHRQHHIGHVHALAVGNGATDNHGAIGKIEAAGINLEADLAVIDQQRRAGHQGRENLSVRQVDTFGVALGHRQIKAELLPLNQFLGSIGKGANAELGPLQIGQNADRATGIGFDLANVGMTAGNFTMVAMAHVQAEHIGPGVEQRQNHLIRVRRRAKRGHDFHIPQASHTALIPVVWPPRARSPPVWLKRTVRATGALPGISLQQN